MPAPRITSRLSPGTYVSEDTYGAVPISLASHSAVYVLGTCTAATFPYNTPIFCSNLADFTTQTVSSPSSAAVETFFNQRSGSGLYFVRVAPRQESTIIATAFTPGTVLTFTISGNTVSYTCVTGDTAATATDGLGKAINNNFAGTASYVRTGVSTAVARYNTALTASVSANVTLGAPSTAATPKAYDVSDAIRNTFVPENDQGYLCAPEFFQAFTLQSERTALQLAIESLCADPLYYWVGVIDFGEAVATSSFFVTAAKSERATFVSPRGNCISSFPYLINLSGANVPSSLAHIGVALRRMRAEGFVQPPAGVNYPVYGIKGTTVNINAASQDQLNPLGINCIRTLPNKGTVVYGARTLATSTYYRFAAVRVILNVLAGTLQDSFDGFILSTIDGQGVMLSRIRQTANNVCEILRLAGGLYGATPEQAYLVVCDNTNNTLDGLESGTVQLDVVVKPSPTMEVLNITVSRASLSTVLVEVAASGTPA